MADCSVEESLRLIEDLKFFLATAPANWQENQVIRRYYLNHDEGFVSCVYWNNLYFVTGTDIVRCIVYKFEHFGRKIIDRKKFEEGVFSDLRNLKCGTDAILEPPRLDFLEFLFKNLCLRTQKKQKVFFWFNVPHDKLMADALERDLKKESLDQKPTTIAYREPAVSFNFDDQSPLYSQLIEHMDKQQKFSKTDSDDNIDENLQVRQDQQEQTNRITEVPEEEEDGDIHGDAMVDKSNSGTKLKGFDFLAQPTPAQFKNSEYEDDFPLDYFDTQNGEGAESDEYFNVDVGGVMGGGNSTGNYEEQYDTYIDPSIFIAPTANPLVFNNEYLIEQTQPLKSAKYPPPTSFPQAMASGRLASSKDEYFPGSQPQSAKYTQFQRPGGPQLQIQQFPGSQSLPIQPQQQQPQPQQQQQQQQQQGHFWNESNNFFPQQQYYTGEGVYLPYQQQLQQLQLQLQVQLQQQQQDLEYWTYVDQQTQLQQQQQQQQPQFTQQYQLPMLNNGNYYIPANEGEGYNPILQGMNTSIPIHHPISSGGMHSAGELVVNRTPSRHHPINNKLINMKRQGPLSQRNFTAGGGVSKLDSAKRQPYGNLQEVVVNKSAKAAKKEDLEQKISSSSSKKASFIPTPESSVTNVETNASNPAQSE